MPSCAAPRSETDSTRVHAVRRRATAPRSWQPGLESPFAVIVPGSGEAPPRLGARAPTPGNYGSLEFGFEKPEFRIGTFSRFPPPSPQTIEKMDPYRSCIPVWDRVLRGNDPCVIRCAKLTLSVFRPNCVHGRALTGRRRPATAHSPRRRLGSPGSVVPTTPREEVLHA